MAFTFFMRDQPTLEHAADHMIPYASGRSRIKIWDAGCALGQETYTIAMVFAEKMNPFAFKNLRIDASDYDSANNFGDVVTAAVYQNEELQRTPAHLLEKYFEPADKPGYMQVSEQLRSRIYFQYHDLLTLKPVGLDYCLVVCKNVMLHFQYPERVEVFQMFHQALAPGGYLATENTQKLPAEVAHLFTQVVPDAQLYKKVGKWRPVRVFHLEKNETIYSCNSYLILGDWNRVEDVNTIIDPGTDDFILNQIEALATGLGKVPVEQVILTHNHFDHNGGVRALKNRYGARVLAYADGADVDELLVDGHFLKAGDDFLEVIHTPGHSSDSICLYAPSIRTLFSGDTQVRIRSAGDVYTQEYLDGLIEICNRNITTIYSGHDDVMTEQVKEMLQTSVANVRKCTVVASLGESAK